MAPIAIMCSDMGDLGTSSPAFMGSSSVTGTTSVTINIPTGTTNQDLLVLAAATDTSGGPNSPAGWTTLHSGFWCRTWNSGDPTSVTIVTSAGGVIAALMFRFRGVQIGGWSSSPAGGNDQTRITCPGPDTARESNVDLPYHLGVVAFGVLRRNDPQATNLEAASPLSASEVNVTIGRVRLVGSYDFSSTIMTDRHFTGVVDPDPDPLLFPFRRLGFSAFLVFPDDYYPPAAQPFLTDFPADPPDWAPSIHVRDPAGRLLSVHGYEESAENTGNFGSDYGQALFRSGDGSYYFTSWDTGAIFRIGSSGETIWRKEYAPGVLGSSTTGPCLSPDGQHLYLHNDAVATENITALNVADGSIAFTRLLTFDPPFESLTHFGGSTFYPYGMINMPNGHLLAQDGNDYLLFEIDMATGETIPFLDLNDLDLPRYYNRGFDMDRKPDGTGFVVAVMTTSPSWSALVELDWSGNVLNLYTKDGNPTSEWLNNVCYSEDGKYLYASTEGWQYLWRFDVGPGNVGGAEPFMNLDYLSWEDWQADGGYGNETYERALWSGTFFGVATWGPSDVGGGGWAAGIRL